jgi:Zn-dependent protease
MLLWAVPVMCAVSVHEVMHGMVASYLGDNTARRMGRLSLNPLRHVDLLGSIVVPVVLLWISGFVFGWARAVPVNVQNLENPGRDMIFVAVAGPLANFLMSLLWAIIMKLGIGVSASLPVTGLVLVYMGAAGVFINTAIMMLNLLPLPPLDGGRILAGLIPDRFGRWLIRIEPWGFPILLVMIIAGLAGKLIWPMMVVGMAVVTYVVDIPVDLLTDALWVLLGETA